MVKKFQELVKQFATLRSYTREFLIYGFRSREEITLSSPRTYDNERRRLESLLHDYIESQTVNNKKAIAWYYLRIKQIIRSMFYGKQNLSPAMIFFYISLFWIF